MTKALLFLIPGRLETRTGGYEYDRQMIAALRSRGWDVAVGCLDGSFPQPTSAALAEARRLLFDARDGTTVLVDGLALGAMPIEVGIQRERLRVMALVHHPLADETGLDAGTVARLYDSERRALSAVSRVAVTSARTADRLATAYGVHRDRIVVVEPGTTAAPLAQGSGGVAPHLLCVASFSPRKGHDVLVRALAALADRDWMLACVGGLDLYPETVAHLRAGIEACGLTGRVQLHGEADGSRVAAYYDRSDVFVLPTLYEGYGMVVAEALARGLPVVSTPTGAIAELVGPDAGILVPPGDVDGWRSALSRVFDPDERRRLAEGARARRDALPRWEEAAARLERALTMPTHQVAGSGRG